ncbi:MAG: GTPase/DUF3482 domain-containing protein [Planctomycetota bacterium]
MPEPLPNPDAPVFAVVGHPNKGKSSIVATLAEDAGVKIAPRPGTTTTADRFAMDVGGQTLYTLVDTPGFENPRRALAWMRERETAADQRAQVVAEFIRTHRDEPSFSNEVELLKPITQGAGVLYVVDGSVPYSDEYEAEMEIMRWTGQPRMALINPIGAADYRQPWRAALDQYFSLVREFNAVTAPFEKHVELLRSFGELREAWAKPMRQAADELARRRDERRRGAARKIAELLADMLTLTQSQTLRRDEDATPFRDELQDKLRGKLRAMERRSRLDVAEVYGHGSTQTQEQVSQDDELLSGDLFSESSWILFGLQTRHLVMAGVASGAAAGGFIDASVGAASFLTGTVIGAIVGGGVGWYSAGRVAKIPVRSRLLGPAIGGRKLTCGPIRNINFPFVVLGRARYHHGLIANRNHAVQGVLKLQYEEQDAGKLNPLTGEQTRALSRIFGKLGKSRRDGEQVQSLVDRLTELLDPLLK